MKSRYCMTLDRELMRRVDRVIDGMRLRNRSQAVELFLRLGMERYRPERTALILCGGLGTRLRPLTFAMPKPMLPIGYRPLLEYQIAYLKRHGFDRIILAVAYLQEQIVRYFSDGQRLGVRIQYSFEKEPLDTAGAIKSAQRLINSDFLVLNGDIVFDSLDLARMFELHKESGATATIGLTGMIEPTRFGAVQVSDDNRVLRFVEKPKEYLGTGWLVNAGIYVFSPRILSYIRAGKRASLERDIFPKLAEEGKIVGFKYDGYWRDIGTQEDYLEVQRDLLTGALRLSVEEAMQP